MRGEVNTRIQPIKQTVEKTETTHMKQNFKEVPHID